MKALKIDVVNKTITNININKENFSTEIYQLIGNGCNTFCCPIDFENGDCIYADDESLLHENIEGCFMLPDWNYPIVGNAIILGTDEEGDSIDCKTNPSELLENVIWGNKEATIEYREKALNSMYVINFDNNAE